MTAHIFTPDLIDGEVIYANANQLTTQTLAQGVLTIINFETVEADSRGSITTGAAWQFAAPLRGVYHIDAVVSFGGSAVAGAYLIEINKNGISVRRGFQTNANAYPTIVALPVSATLKLAAGDKIDVRALQNPIVSMNTQVGPGFHLTWIDIVRLPLSA